MGNHEALLTVFGPSGGPFGPGLERSGPLEFVALDADERTLYERTEPLGSFGPYAAGGHQAQYQDVWITAVSLDSADPTWTVAVRVVARIRSDAGVRWWALRVPADTAEGRISGKEPFRVDPVEGGPAAPPILIASFETTAHGHTADIGTTVRLALDFRGAKPRALAKLECSSSDTRQSCTGGWGFKDTDFWTGTSADCVWSVAQGRLPLPTQRVRRHGLGRTSLVVAHRPRERIARFASGAQSHAPARAVLANRLRGLGRAAQGARR